MLFTADDFRIKASNFDLTNSANVLRIICGAFMFPHIAGKFAGGALSASTVGFFAKAGFQPPDVWVFIAAAAESIAAVALILGALFLRLAWRLRRETTTARAGVLFKFSLLYLALLFVALALDTVVL